MPKLLLQRYTTTFFFFFIYLLLLVIGVFAPAEFQPANFGFQKICNSSFVTNGLFLLHRYRFL